MRKSFESYSTSKMSDPNTYRIEQHSVDIVDYDLEPLRGEAILLGFGAYGRRWFKTADGREWYEECTTSVAQLSTNDTSNHEIRVFGSMMTLEWNNYDWTDLFNEHYIDNDDKSYWKPLKHSL